jgi:hypothetical protein
MGWNSTSELCLSESESENFFPFTIGVGVAILDRMAGATTANMTIPASASSNASTPSTQSGQNHATNTIPTAIGIGAAVSVGISLISAAMVLLWRHRKRRAHQTFQQIDLKNSAPPTPLGPLTPYTPLAPCNRPISPEYSGHIELEYSPRHFQGLGIQELDGNTWNQGHNVSQYKGV